MKQFDRTSESVQPLFVKSKVGKYSKVLSEFYRLGPLLATSVRSTKQTKPCVLRTQHAFPQHSTVLITHANARPSPPPSRDSRHDCVVLQHDSPRPRRVRLTALARRAGMRRRHPTPTGSLLILRETPFVPQHFSTLCVCPEPVLTNNRFPDSQHNQNVSIDAACVKQRRCSFAAPGSPASRIAARNESVPGRPL